MGVLQRFEEVFAAVIQNKDVAKKMYSQIIES